MEPGPRTNSAPRMFGRAGTNSQIWWPRDSRRGYKRERYIFTPTLRPQRMAGRDKDRRQQTTHRRQPRRNRKGSSRGNPTPPFTVAPGSLRNLERKKGPVRHPSGTSFFLPARMLASSNHGKSEGLHNAQSLLLATTDGKSSLASRFPNPASPILQNCKKCEAAHTRASKQKKQRKNSVKTQVVHREV